MKIYSSTKGLIDVEVTSGQELRSSYDNEPVDFEYDNTACGDGGKIEELSFDEGNYILFRTNADDKLVDITENVVDLYQTYRHSKIALQSAAWAVNTFTKYY